MKQFVYDARGFRERCEPGTITDVRTWRKGGDSAVHRATAVSLAIFNNALQVVSITRVTLRKRVH